MPSRLLAAALLIAFVGCARPPAPPEEQPTPEPTVQPKPEEKDKADAVAKSFDRVLPGFRKDGFVQLPNQWQLKPAGRHIEVGDLPVNIVFHPTGQFAAILHAGYQTHEVVVVDLNPKNTRIVSR